MTLKKQLGDAGEAAARRYLEDRGYQFVGANWRCKCGEVDLIMKDGSVLVFVEVRVRWDGTKFGESADTVSWQKQRKLIRTAQAYQQAQSYWGDMRFDVMAIDCEAAGSFKMEHISHAFTA